MEENISTSTLDCFKEVKTVNQIIENAMKLKNLNEEEFELERLTEILDGYLEQPHLIDPYLEGFITKLLDMVKTQGIKKEAFHQVFKYLYLFLKVRGYKYTLRHFSHEVSDVEYVLALLHQQKSNEFKTWETRYVILLWLSMVAIIPFDLVKLDGKSTDKKSIIERIYDTILPYLTVADKSRDAAAYAMSKFLTRPDIKNSKLVPFVNWCIERLNNFDLKSVLDVNSVSGVLSALALLFKHGKRDDLLPLSSKVLNMIEELKLLEVQNTLIRKLTIKLTQRLGLIFLVPRIASWRYLRGSRSLADNLQNKTNVITKENGMQEIQSDEENFDVPDVIENVLEVLLNGLKDKDTIVRWSAAKGVGRVAGRLPRELADDVVGSLLELFMYTELDGAWHGGCLALAELGRRGLLLPSCLPEVVPIILRALRYDERRGSYSVGAHVRDAACYVCWSFARAYDPDQIKAFIVQIATSLLITTIFDREVNCRRAASAAFQENVGRQGTFPHGIDILTAADYYAVGNITYCFTELSVFVGGFKEYTHALIDHLVDTKISHWDRSIRELASKGLHALTKLDPDYMLSKALPSLIKSSQTLDLSTKDGAILAIAEITHALTEHKGGRLELPDDILNVVKATVKNLRQSNQFKGHNGEILRKSVCRLIEKFSISKIEIDDNNVLEDWLYILEDTIPNTEPPVQEHAISALPHFCIQYIQNSTYFNKNEILTRLLSKLSAQLKFERMGFAQAVGALPLFMVQDNITRILGCLVSTSKVDENKINSGLYAESRRDAINAISRQCSSLTFSNQTLCGCVDEIFECLFLAMEDYTMDSRGDVGAWVREAAMSGLVKVTYLLLESNREDLVTKQRCLQIVQDLLQQSAEKIDRTRLHAGNLLMEFLHHIPKVPNISRKEDLVAAIPRSYVEELNWSVPSKVFPVLIKLIPLREYQYHLLLGMTVSVGGLTESLVRASSDCLQNYFMVNQHKVDDIMFICGNVLKIIRNYAKDARVIYPMFRVLDLLLSSGCFYEYISNEAFQSFPLELTELIKAEIKNSADAKKILYSVNVFCGLLQFPGSIRRSCFKMLALYLAHKYPRVRQLTSEQLYTALITYDDIIAEENYQNILATLSETAWNDSIDKIRPARNKICEWLDIPPPKLKVNSSAQQTATKKVDELDSYQDLVSRDGY